MLSTCHDHQLTLICAGFDARPLFWTDNSRQRYGYEPDVAQALASHLDLELVWLFCQWSEFATRLQDDQADAIWCGSAITPAREQQFLYSRPYAIFNESALIRRGDGIKSPQDLVGRRVAAISNSTNMALAEQWQGCHCIGFDGVTDDVLTEMVDALEIGDVDAVVDDEPAFGGLSQGGKFEIAFTVETENRWGAAMRLESFALKQVIDEALGILAEQQILKQIWDQNFPNTHYPDL